jgi:hypothetical protein
MITCPRISKFFWFLIEKCKCPGIALMDCDNMSEMGMSWNFVKIFKMSCMACSDNFKILRRFQELYDLKQLVLENRFLW